MGRTALLAIVGGLASALYFVALGLGTAGFASGMLMVVGYFAQLPLFLVGFSLGVSPALMAAGTAVLIVGLGAGMAPALLYAMTNAAPVLVVTRQFLLSRQTAGATEWYPYGRLVSDVTVLGLAGAGTIAALALIGAGGLLGPLQDTLGPPLAAMMAEVVPPEQANETREVVDAFLEVMPGFFLVSWLLMILLNGAMAQGLLTSSNRAIRPTPRLSEMYLPDWLAIAFGFALLIALAAPGDLGFIGTNLTIALCAPFALGGLATVHTVSLRWRARLLMLIVFYILFVTTPWMAPGTVILGVADQWFGLRRRYAPPGGGATPT